MPKLMLSLLLIFSACGEETRNAEAERLELLRTDIEFAEASRVMGAAEAFKIYLSEDAFQLPDNAEPVFGRDKIYEMMLAGPKMILTWQPQLAEVSRAADMGFTWGNYQAKWQNEADQEQVSHGKYLNIWKKQPDGSWRVVVDMGNQTPQ